MEKLKPCPFCGKLGSVRTVNLNDYEEPIWVAICILRAGGCGASSRMETTESKAVLAWNRRVEGEDK